MLRIATNEVSLDVKFIWAGFCFGYLTIQPFFRAELPGNRAVVEKKGQKFVIFGGFSVKLGMLIFRKQL